MGPRRVSGGRANWLRRLFQADCAKAPAGAGAAVPDRRGRRATFRRRALGLALGAPLGFAAPAAVACDIALVLAIDVSGSVDAREDRIQMDGLAAALRDPTIRAALTEAEARLAVVQWSGSNRQKVVADWSGAGTGEEIDAIADVIVTAPRAFRHYSTAIGEALGVAADLLGAVGGDCRRKVIDVSGDGISNEGVEVTVMRDALVRGGIVINGLAIEASEPGIAAYFERDVIGGGGAFVLTARTYEDYPEAIRRKLLRELSDRIVMAPEAVRQE